MEQRSVAGIAGCGARQCAGGRRLVLGVGVLMVVDGIWVASAVLSEVGRNALDRRTHLQ